MIPRLRRTPPSPPQLLFRAFLLPKANFLNSLLPDLCLRPFHPRFLCSRLLIAIGPRNRAPPYGVGGGGALGAKASAADDDDSAFDCLDGGHLCHQAHLTIQIHNPSLRPHQRVWYSLWNIWVLWIWASEYGRNLCTPTGIRTACNRGINSLETRIWTIYEYCPGRMMWRMLTAF